MSHKHSSLRQSLIAALATFSLLLCISIDSHSTTNRSGLHEPAPDHKFYFGNLHSHTSYVNNSARAAAAPRRSSILVKINPRRVSTGSAGDGSARVSLLDGAGTAIGAFPATVPPYNLAVGVNGPRRDIQRGDTPFGVYKFTETKGGTETDKLGKGYGTGKVHVDDRNFSYGEMEDARPRRYLIRLHGGGSGLANPYALDQPLRQTWGCVRMKNRDVNALIQLIKARPRAEALEYIFMGNDAYLNALATNTGLSNKPWWNALRIALGMSPVTPPSPAVTDSSASQPSVESVDAGESRTTQDADAALVELVKLFAEDEGEKGQEALRQLQPQRQALLRLRDSLPAADALQPQLAFVLCYLETDCVAGVRVLESALREPSRFSGFYTEQTAQMISRLIDKSVAEGNDVRARELMTALFTAAPQADGALSEGLGIALSEKLRDKTSLFLSAYKELFAVSASVDSVDSRSKVYELILTADHLSPEDITTIRQKIDAIRDPSREFRNAVRELRREYFQPYQRLRRQR